MASYPQTDANTNHAEPTPSFRGWTVSSSGSKDNKGSATNGDRYGEQIPILNGVLPYRSSSDANLRQWNGMNRWPRLANRFEKLEKKEIDLRRMPPALPTKILHIQTFEFLDIVEALETRCKELSMGELGRVSGIGGVMAGIGGVVGEGEKNGGMGGVMGEEASVSGICRAAAAESLGVPVGSVYFLRGKVGGFAVNKLIGALENHPNLYRLSQDMPVGGAKGKKDTKDDGAGKNEDADKDKKAVCANHKKDPSAAPPPELRDFRSLFEENCEIVLSSTGPSNMIRLCSWQSVKKKGDDVGEEMRSIELRIYDSAGTRGMGRVDWDVRTRVSGGDKDAQKKLVESLEHPVGFRRDQRPRWEVGPMAPRKKEEVGDVECWEKCQFSRG